MRISEIATLSAERLRTIKAVASAVRLDILRYLKDPIGNFPAQADGDLIEDGVCADFIREKLGIAAATASRHLTLRRKGHSALCEAAVLRTLSSTCRWSTSTSMCSAGIPMGGTASRCSWTR